MVVPVVCHGLILSHDLATVSNMLLILVLNPPDTIFC